MKASIIGITLLISSSLALADTVFLESDRIEARGREQFRDTLLWKEKNREGRSGSNQYVDFFQSTFSREKVSEEEGDYKIKGPGILLGTNSNLLKYPDIYLGVSMGYFRGKEKQDGSEEQERLRNYGVNAEVAYIKNRYMLLGGVGYTELRHSPKEYKRYREREGRLFTEFGKLIPLSEKDYIYPYLGASFQKVEGRREIPANDIGVSYTRFWNEKWSTKLQAQYNHEWKPRRVEHNYRDAAQLLAAVSYQWYEDLEVRLQYRANIHKKVYQDTLSLGFSHNF